MCQVNMYKQPKIFADRIRKVDIVLMTIITQRICGLLPDDKDEFTVPLSRYLHNPAEADAYAKVKNLQISPEIRDYFDFLRVDILGRPAVHAEVEIEMAPARYRPCVVEDGVYGEIGGLKDALPQLTLVKLTTPLEPTV